MRTKKYSDWLNGEYIPNEINGRDRGFKDLSWVVAKKVKGNFDCSRNKIGSLKNGPIEVGGTYGCEHNRLKSLRGAPKEVGRDFWCNNNRLTSLKDGPEKVGWEYLCFNNELTDLEGSPKQIKGCFHCSFNKLKTLKGGPEKVGSFVCENNPLTSLEGAPKEIGIVFEGPFKMSGKDWGPKGWVKILASDNLYHRKLIRTIFTDEMIDKWFKENPADISILDHLPELKAEVLKRTGIRDLSRLSRNLKTGLI